MQILQLCKKFPYPAKDGETIAIMSLTKSLKNAGAEITVLSFNTQKHFAETNSLPDEVKSIGEFHSVNIDTKITPLGAFKNLFNSSSFHINRFESEVFSDRLKTILTLRDFDIIQLEGLTLAYYLPIIRKYSKAKVVMRAHNVEHEIWLRLAHQSIGLKKWYLNLQAKRLRNFEIFHLNSYDALVPITDRDGEIFQNLGCRIPMHVSSTGIDAEIISSNPRSNANSVFFIGGMDWIPNRLGVEWFIKKVWKTLQSKYPHLKLSLAGKNFPADLKTDPSQNIIVFGEVENAHEFIREQSIMIVPLFSGSGMRIKIIEGMALGKVVVSTSIGAEGIHATHEENILIADDTHSFIHAIEKCITDWNSYIMLSQNALKFVRENFDNQKIGSELLRFYRTLTN